MIRKPWVAWIGAGICALLAWPGFAQEARARSGPIAPGDVLFIEVYRVPELTSSVTVDTRGNIDLPYIDPVNLRGLTQSEAAGRVADALGGILRNPRVSVSKSGSRISSASKPARTRQMRMEIIPLQNSNAVVLAEVLQGMSSLGGSISPYQDANTLVVTDTPETIQNIMNAVTRLDQMQTQLTQVRIEAKIAEVRVGALKELGIRWFFQSTDVLTGFTPVPTQDPGLNLLRGGLSPSSAERDSGGGGGGSGGSGDGGGSRTFVQGIPTRRLAYPITVPVPGQAFLGFANAAIDVGSMLDALVSDNKAELLANPMTVTVNHQPAQIKMVDEYPYTEFGTEITGASSFSTEFMELGIILDVTPHVYRDSEGPYVKMELDIEVSFAVGSSNGVPIRSVRSTKSQPSVRDGQTLVIGGILKNEERSYITKVPGLGSIPMIGLLFKRKEKSKLRTELMIFVTPTVYDRPEDITWDRMIDISKALQEASMIPTAEIRREQRKD